MIFYFSGTGNSKWVAQQLAIYLEDKTTFIPSVLDTSDFSLCENEKIGFVFPIYSWGVPPIVLQFIAQLNNDFSKNNYLYFVCSCGDETGLAPNQFIKAVEKKGWKCNAGFSIIMPNNYVLLPGFDIDSIDVMQKKLDKAPQRVEVISKLLQQSYTGIDCFEGGYAYLKTKLIYPLFAKWGIFPKKFYSTNLCNGCHRCEKACPTKNIVLVDRRPKWGSNCTSCLACFHICPLKAIEYGSATKNKGRYFHP